MTGWQDLNGAVVAGLLAGTLHAVSGADHLGAVLPLCVNRPLSHAWPVGLNWGVGHAVGAAVLGVAAFGVKERLNLQLLADWLDLAVGLVLVAIGISGLWSAADWDSAVEKKHSHIGGEVELEEVFPSSSVSIRCENGRDTAHQRSMSPSKRKESASAASNVGSCALLQWHVVTMGVMHGISGSGHVLGLFVALTLPSWSASMGYFLSYMVGCGAAMAVFTGLVGHLSVVLRHRTTVTNLPSLLSRATSFVAVVVGIVWIYSGMWVIVGSKQ